MSDILEANEKLIKSMIDYFNDCETNTSCVLCLKNNSNILAFKPNENLKCQACVDMSRVCVAYNEAHTKRSELKRMLAKYPVSAKRELFWIEKPATWGEVKTMMLFGCVILTLLIMFYS
jgi:hypothetical protein